jgi:hypothetical protein
MVKDNFFMQVNSAIKAGRVPDSGLALEALNRRMEAQTVIDRLRGELRKWGAIERTFTALALDLMGAPRPDTVSAPTTTNNEIEEGNPL